MANDIKASKEAMTRRSRLLIVFIGLLINARYLSPTRAQTTDLPSVAPHSSITLQDENAFIGTASLTDRYYINSLRLGYILPTNITLDSGQAPYTLYVSMINAVGEMELGAALIWDGVRLSYTQVFQTHEFHDQRSSMHQFGSLAAGVWF